VGNRIFGRRLASLINFEALKLAAGLMLVSPYVPLMFMGEEYGEDSPFLYFVSHSDPELINAVRKGRAEEFKSFNWLDEVPDPQVEETFLRSKLKWEMLEETTNKRLFEFYKFLINFRKENIIVNDVENNFSAEGTGKDKVISLRYNHPDKKIFAVFNLNDSVITDIINVPEGNWKKIIESSDEDWCGSGSSTQDTLLGKPQNITLKQWSFSLYKNSE
jgi:maltooligosyltrehalose trehalohydrolase